MVVGDDVADRMAGLSRRSDVLLVGDDLDDVDVWRRAVVIFEAMPMREPEPAFFEGCCHAMLSSIAGQARPKAAGMDEIEVARAIHVLRRAAEIGYRDSDAYRTETALVPLRNRPEFRMLMLDLDFPADPFAGAR